MKYPHSFMVSLYDDMRESLARAIDALYKDARFLLEYSEVHPSCRASVRNVELRRFRLDSFDAVESAVLLLRDVRELYPERYDTLLWREAERRLLDVLLDRIRPRSSTPFDRKLCKKK